MSSSDLSEWASEDEAPALVRPTFKSENDEIEWERKQRNREYRVAARREKRTRKADEKKQRKLNATILRRMTKNPDKYNKNVDRNRRRDIEMERRKIYKEAVSQAERLAAIHDPSGKMFNVSPVITQDDGKVVSLEFLHKKAHLQAERDARLAQCNGVAAQPSSVTLVALATTTSQIMDNSLDDDNKESRESAQITERNDTKPKRLSKNQQKKLALLEERPPPPKPVIPDRIKLPDGEENWLALWDLSDDELERRVIREKKRKAAERKALRQKQKEGKAERRAARDERRRVYREKKLEWKAIKEEEKTQKRKLLRVEQEEAKRIEIEVNLAERRRAMEVCAELGFTLDNVEGVADIKPKALGMKGQEVDFDILEIGKRPSELKIKGEKRVQELEDRKFKGNRVDLGNVIDESKTRNLASGGTTPAGLEGDFVSLNFGGGVMDQQSEELNYNHKLRRKLHRAIEAAQIQKELLVRAKAKEYCEITGIEVPSELAAEYKPIRLSGRRILEDGTLETEKQERVRKRLELAEYNKAAKVLRQQAKAEAIEAGLRVFAELTGKNSMDVTEVAPFGIGRETKPGSVNDTIERNKSGATRDFKKHQQEDKDADINVTGKSKKSKRSSALIHSLDAEVSDAREVEKKTKKQDVSGLTTLRVLPSSATEIFHHKISELKGKKRKTTHEQEEGQTDQLSRVEDDKAMRKAKKMKLKKEREVKETKEDSSSRITPLSEKNFLASSKKSKKRKLQKTELVRTPEIDVMGSEISPQNLGNTVEGELIVKNGYQWSLDALNGGTARKDKFLKLLGGSKINSDTSERPSRKSKVEKGLAGFGELENELERQFEAGIRMKHDAQRKKGLGA